MVLYVRHFGEGALYHAGLRLLQRARDADLLVDVHVYLLLGDPAVLVLQDVQRRLGVAHLRGVVQRLGGVELAVGAALLFGQFHQRVELGQLAKLRGRQTGVQRKAVTLQAQLGCGVDRFQPRFGRRRAVGGIGQ